MIQELYIRYSPQKTIKDRIITESIHEDLCRVVKKGPKKTTARQYSLLPQSVSSFSLSMSFKDYIEPQDVWRKFKDLPLTLQQEYLQYLEEIEDSPIKKAILEFINRI